MPLSLPQMQIGAYVEDIFDAEGREKKVRRRGYIVRIDYQRGQAFTGDVENIWVQFDKDKAPEKVPNACLAVIRGFDAVAAGRIKQENENALAERVVEDKKPITQDKTGVETKERISEHSAKKFGLKTGHSA